MIQIRRTSHEWGTLVEAMLGEEPVSSLKIHDLRVRVGDVILRCGGIGAVGTVRQHRLKGYSRALLEDAVAYMRDQGYHLSALFGIPNYYDKYGFAPALIESEVSIVTRDAELAQAQYAIRESLPQDAGPMVEIYERICAQRTGCVVRDPAKWSGFHRGAGWTDRVGTFVVLDGEQIVGYACYNLDPWRYAINEVGYRDASVYETLLAEVANRAVSMRVERITFCLPPDDPFARYCRRYGADVTIKYRRCAGGMARLADQTAALELLLPLFRQRLRDVGLAEWAGEIVLETDLSTDRLAFGRGGVSHRLRLPQWALAQLILGYRSAEDALSERGAAADADVRPVLRALFPEGYPYMWPDDRF